MGTTEAEHQGQHVGKSRGLASESRKSHLSETK